MFTDKQIFAERLVYARYNPCTSIIQFRSVTQSCLNLCDPMDCTMPGFPVHHHLPELDQTRVHLVSDATQPSHALSSPSPPAFRIFSKCVSSSHQVAKVLEFQLHHHFFQWIFSTDLLRTDWFDLLAVQGTLKSLLQQTVQKHQFFSAQVSL